MCASKPMVRERCSVSRAKGLVLCWLHDPGEAARLSIIAVDVFFGDEAAKEIVGFPRLGKQRPCRSSTITARQRAQRRLQRMPSMPPLRELAPMPGVSDFEYDDGATGASKRQRRRQSSVARADDRHIGARRQCWRLDNGGRACSHQYGSSFMIGSQLAARLRLRLRLGKIALSGGEGARAGGRTRQRRSRTPSRW